MIRLMRCLGFLLALICVISPSAHAAQKNKSNKGKNNAEKKENEAVRKAQQDVKDAQEAEQKAERSLKKALDDWAEKLPESGEEYSTNRSWKML